MNKVIEILEEELGKIKDTGLPTSSGKELMAWNAAGMARHIYARIAPLREFPEEAMKALVSDVWCRGYNSAVHKVGKVPLFEDVSDIIADLKRLFWEGTEDEPRVPYEEHPQNCLCNYHSKHPKGGCPTCRGSRKVNLFEHEKSACWPIANDATVSPPKRDCPDCTGERTLENRTMSILTEMRRKELYGRESFDEWWECACRIADECRKEVKS